MKRKKMSDKIDKLPSNGKNVCRSTSASSYASSRIENGTFSVKSGSVVKVVNVCCKGFVQRGTKCVKKANVPKTIKTPMPTKSPSSENVALELAVGTAVGVTVLVILIALTVYMLRKKKKNKNYGCCKGEKEQIQNKVKSNSPKVVKQQSFNQYDIPHPIEDVNNKDLTNENKIYTEVQYSPKNLYQDLHSVNNENIAYEISPVEGDSSNKGDLSVVEGGFDSNGYYNDGWSDEIQYEVPPEDEEEDYIEIVS